MTGFLGEHSCPHPRWLRREGRIVWVNGHQPEEHVFVREGSFVHHTRAGSPARSKLPAGLVAYAELAPEAQPDILYGAFVRRCWWRAPHDEAVYGATTSPMEAVDPCSIRPCRPSRPPRREAA